MPKYTAEAFQALSARAKLAVIDNNEVTIEKRSGVSGDARVFDTHKALHTNYSVTICGLHFEWKSTVIGAMLAFQAYHTQLAIEAAKEERGHGYFLCLYHGSSPINKTGENRVMVRYSESAEACLDFLIGKYPALKPELWEVVSLADIPGDTKFEAVTVGPVGG